MNKREFHYRWEWQLQSSPEAFWPFISDTNHFNRDTGIPAIEQRLREGEQVSNARRRLRLYRLGVTVEWDEEPFEWVYPYRYGVVRRYLSGPLEEMRTLAELTAQPGGGSRFVYQVWARPKNLLGLVAIPAQIGILNARSFDQAVRRYDQLAARQKTSPADWMGAAAFAPGGRERLATLREELLKRGAPPDLVMRLVETILRADDIVLARLRPYALADAWEARRRDVLEVCLWAVRIGLLDFQWDVLCPLCRVSKSSAPGLGGLQSQVHCETCNIDFTANFERSVELTFRPNPAIRGTERRDFCLGGPQTTPHIVAQQLLGPHSEREVSLPLKAGRHRVRTLGLRSGQFFQAADDGEPQGQFPARESGWPDDELRLSLAPRLWLENRTAEDQLFIVERMAWSDQAVTAAEVITLQLFRDLFASEALRPGEQISVGNLTILFTDLRDSTRLYRTVGDAVAFGRVMSHFDVLKAAISTEQGSLVKTIGDSVMAAFIQPLAALRTILRVQHELANPPAGLLPLQLKAGINYGPCIAVTLNDRLDYFGSTVNLAARLEGLSSEGGIVISDSVRGDPEIVRYFDALGNLIRVEPFTATVKGFDEENFRLWRVRLTQADTFSQLVKQPQ